MGELIAAVKRLNSNMASGPDGIPAEAIKELNPKFRITYNVDPKRQSIPDSWPRSLDDSAARIEWGWKPEFSFEELVSDMYINLSEKLQK